MISDASSAHSPSPPPLLTPPMVLGTPLAAEEEAFLAGHRHERIVIDATLRLIVLNYLSPTADAPMVKEPVPPGVNIFDMMDLRVPDNVSRLDGWAIMIYPNSSQYTTLQVAFGVSACCTIGDISSLHSFDCISGEMGKELFLKLNSVSAEQEAGGGGVGPISTEPIFECQSGNEKEWCLL